MLHRIRPLGEDEPGFPIAFEQHEQDRGFATGRELVRALWTLIERLSKLFLEAAARRRHGATLYRSA
jgi:hypothetical protein